MLVSKAVPALEVKVVREVVEEVETNFKIEQIQDTDQFQGYVKVMQKGEKGLTKVTSRVSYIDGVEVDREEIDSEVISEPITEKVIVGGKRPLDKIPSGGTASGNFIWPAAGRLCQLRLLWLLGTHRHGYRLQLRHAGLCRGIRYGDQGGL